MRAYPKMTAQERAEEYACLKAEFQKLKDCGLKLNMARGKPAREQLDLSEAFLNSVTHHTGTFSNSGEDCRNYGLLFGIEECRRLFGEILDVDYNNVIACGNSSLVLMYDYISQCMTHGAGGYEPWSKQPGAKFIAVVPGYDRHFAIAEYFGLEMIDVEMTRNGPDMDKVEELIKDPLVKGMFCVPKYSNPDGVTYSDDTVDRLAKMTPAAPDFRVIWDNAYVVHDFYDEHAKLKNIMKAAAKYGHEDYFVEFASTSKITFPGSGVACIAASNRNINEIAARLSMQIISYDKLNQLRHCHVFKNLEDVQNHMKLHAAILRPKFLAVEEVLDRELTDLGIADWTHPKGGYFISLNVNIGSAKYVGELCKQAGLTITKVGATFPYGKDPTDSNIRLAPTCPSVEELKIATKVICTAAKLAAARALRHEMAEG